MESNILANYERSTANMRIVTWDGSSHKMERWGCFKKRKAWGAKRVDRKTVPSRLEGNYVPRFLQIPLGEYTQEVRIQCINIVPIETSKSVTEVKES
jgi:hypothetical protein